VRKNPATYEHVMPELVGNRQRMLVSDYAGRSGLLEKVEAYGIRLSKDNPKLQELLATLKQLESQGYQFEGAEGSFELLMRKAVGKHKPSFELLGFRVNVEQRQGDTAPISEATVMVKVGDAVEHTAAVGAGPVNALDHALRKALEKFYPQLKEVKLLDYKVRVLTASQGTASKAPTRSTTRATRSSSARSRARTRSSSRPGRASAAPACATSYARIYSKEPHEQDRSRRLQRRARHQLHHLLAEGGLLRVRRGRGRAGRRRPDP